MAVDLQAWKNYLAFVVKLAIAPHVIRGRVEIVSKNRWFINGIIEKRLLVNYVSITLEENVDRGFNFPSRSTSEIFYSKYVHARILLLFYSYLKLAGNCAIIIRDYLLFSSPPTWKGKGNFIGLAAVLFLKYSFDLYS